jgi:hypothetical protein
MVVVCVCRQQRLQGRRYTAEEKRREKVHHGKLKKVSGESLRRYAYTAAGKTYH